MTKLLTIAFLIKLLGMPIIGGGAYYHEIDMREVCRYRNKMGWTPVELDCEWDCLAAWGLHEPEMLGEYVLADLPGGSLHV